MDVQNFWLLQTFAKKEEKLAKIESRQASILSFLRREYETVKFLHKPRVVTKDEKLNKYKTLRDKYTFKIEQKNRSIPKSPQINQELNERRSKMLLAGNSFSKNNLKSIQQQSIRKVSSTMSPLQMKREMLERRNEFGNFCSSNFVKKAASSTKSTDTKLIKRKKTHKLKSSISQHNKHDKNPSHKLINEINQPIISQTEICNDELYRASEAIDISEILNACDEVKRKVSEVRREEMIDYGTTDDAIMREDVKKASQQIECSPSEIDDGNNNGLQIVEVIDEATASRESKVNAVDLEPPENRHEKVSPQNTIEASETSMDSPEKRAKSVIIKLRSALGEMFMQSIEDVTQPSHTTTMEELCENKNAESKSADNMSSSKIQIHATSTFTSKKEIFDKTMEMQRKRIEGLKEEISEEIQISSSNISNASESDSVEIIKRVLKYDE